MHKKDNAITQPPFNTSPSISQNNANSGRRDYVSQFPQLRPISPNLPTQPTPNNNLNSGYPNTQLNNGKRDYVAPQSPTNKPPPTQQTPGKVKDLINFYDKKPQENNVPQGVPSYSSILRGSTTNNLPSSTKTTLTVKYTQPFTQTTSKPSTKPFSYSSVVAGSSKPNTPNQPTLATPKPTTRVPVLPSAIFNNNNNRNNNQGNPNLTDDELKALSEELLRKDINNAARYVTVNYQEKTTSQSKEDKAPLA